VSLMLMGLGGLFREGLVEWVSSMTYQAASGAGAAKMLELMKQMEVLTGAARSAPGADALLVEKAVTAEQRGATLPTSEFGAPLAGSLLAWIDKDMPGGQTKEEWKGEAETNKILGTAKTIPVDGICVRIGTLRCHSQGICVKLNRDVPLSDLEGIVASSTPWTKLVPNTKPETLRDLTPTAVSGTLTVPVGRLHKLRMGPEYLGAFTVGDQLLWGAAEPLRRMVRILRERIG
jgi:aspartate-semialdehyde dehydrogenase